MHLDGCAIAHWCGQVARASALGHGLRIGVCTAAQRDRGYANGFGGDAFLRTSKIDAASQAGACADAS